METSQRRIDGALTESLVLEFNLVLGALRGLHGFIGLADRIGHLAVLELVDARGLTQDLEQTHSGIIGHVITCFLTEIREHTGNLGLAIHHVDRLVHDRIELRVGDVVDVEIVVQHFLGLGVIVVRVFHDLVQFLVELGVDILRHTVRIHEVLQLFVRAGKSLIYVEHRFKNELVRRVGTLGCQIFRVYGRKQLSLPPFTVMLVLLGCTGTSAGDALGHLLT